VAVFDWIKTEKIFGTPLVDRTANRTDKDPAVAAFERVVGFEKPRRPVPGMPVDRTFTGKDRQRVAVGLRKPLHIARGSIYLAPVRFLLTSHSAIIVAAQPVSAVTKVAGIGLRTLAADPRGSPVKFIMPPYALRKSRHSPVARDTLVSRTDRRC